MKKLLVSLIVLGCGAHNQAHAQSPEQILVQGGRKL